MHEEVLSAGLQLVSHGVQPMVVHVMEAESHLFFSSSGTTVRVSWSIILSIAFLVTLFAIFVVRKAVKIHRMKPVSGREGMLGETGIADSDVHADGRVFVRGEYWDAWCEETIERGERIVVIDVEGMMLKVKKGSIMQHFGR